MATQQKLTREEFQAKIVEEIDGGAILSPEKIFHQWIVYPGTLEEYKQRAADITEIMTSETNEESMARLRDFFSGKEVVVGPPEQQNLTQFQAIENQKYQVLPDTSSVISEDRLIDARRAAIASHRARIKQQTIEARKNAHDFTKAYVDEWQRRKMSGEPLKIEATVVKEFEKPNYALSEVEARRRLTQRVSHADPVLQKPGVVEVIAGVFEKNPYFVTSTWDPVSTKIVETVADPSANINSFSESITTLTPVGAPFTPEKVETALVAARVATVVNAPKIDTSAIRIEDLTSNPLISSIGNVISRPPGKQEALINQQVFTNAWNKTVNAEHFIEEMTSQFGKDFVQSESFKKVILSGNKMVSEKSGAQGIAGGFRSIVANAVEPARGTPSEPLKQYIKKLTETGKVPNAHEFVGILFLLRNPTGMKTIPAPAGGSAGGSAGSAALMLGTEVAKQSAGKAITSWLSKIIGAVAGAEIPVVGQIAIAAAVNWVLDRAVEIGGFLLSGLKYLSPATFLQGGDIPWTDALLFILPAAIVVVIVLIAGMSTPLKSFDIPVTIRHEALANGLAKGVALTNNGQVTLVCPSFANAHVYQMDPSWASTTCAVVNPDPNPAVCTAPNTTCTIGASGCGSATMTEILNAFGLQKSIKEVWDQQHKIGGYLYTKPGEAPSCETDNDKSFGVLTSAGLSYSRVGVDELKKIFSAPPDPTRPQDCKRIVYASGWEKFANSGPSGHIVAIIGVQGNDVIALDPARQESTTTLHMVGSYAAATSNYDYWITGVWLVVNKNGGASL